jgi:hypothetical protein
MCPEQECCFSFITVKTKNDDIQKFWHENWFFLSTVKEQLFLNFWSGQKMKVKIYLDAFELFVAFECQYVLSFIK